MIGRSLLLFLFFFTDTPFALWPPRSTVCCYHGNWESTIGTLVVCCCSGPETGISLSSGRILTFPKNNISGKNIYVFEPLTLQKQDIFNTLDWLIISWKKQNKLHTLVGTDSNFFNFFFLNIWIWPVVSPGNENTVSNENVYMYSYKCHPWTKKYVLNLKHSRTHTN